MSHVILFLKSNIDNGLRNFLADSIKELSFSNYDFKLWWKINVVSLGLGLRVFSTLQDVLLEQENGVISIILLPVMENIVLIFCIKLFGKRNVFKGYILADILL